MLYASTRFRRPSRRAGIAALLFSAATIALGWHSRHALQAAMTPLGAHRHGTGSLSADSSGDIADGSTFLILGTDKAVAGHSRSDTMLFGTIHFKPAVHITLLSLPRDTRVQIPGRHGYAKLNAAYSFGKTDLAVQTVEDNLHLTPEHTVVIDTDGLAKVIDALGGVDVTVPAHMEYHDHAQHLDIVLEPGRQHLNGQQAVWFCRWRSDGRGDVGRIGRQQTFVRELATQALTPAALLHLPQILTTLQSSVTTDLSAEQIAQIAYHCKDLKSGNLQTRTLPGHPAYLHGVSYYLPESAPPTLPSVSEKPASGALVIYNGTTRHGLARKLAAYMQSSGWSVAKTGNASAPGTETLVSSPDPEAARKVHDILKFGRVVSEEADRTERGKGIAAVTITLGTDCPADVSWK